MEDNEVFVMQFTSICKRFFPLSNFGKSNAGERWKIDFVFTPNGRIVYLAIALQDASACVCGALFADDEKE